MKQYCLENKELIRRRLQIIVPVFLVTALSVISLLWWPLSAQIVGIVVLLILGSVALLLGGIYGIAALAWIYRIRI